MTSSAALQLNQIHNPYSGLCTVGRRTTALGGQESSKVGLRQSRDFSICMRGSGGNSPNWHIQLKIEHVGETGDGWPWWGVLVTLVIRAVSHKSSLKWNKIPSRRLSWFSRLCFEPLFALLCFDSFRYFGAQTKNSQKSKVKIHSRCFATFRDFL